MNPHRPLPAHTDAACAIKATWVLRAHTSHLAATRTQHAALAEPPHMTRRNHARCDGAVLPAQHAGARFPIARAGSSSEDQVQLEGG